MPTCAACGGSALYQTDDADALAFCDEFCQLDHYDDAQTGGAGWTPRGGGDYVGDDVNSDEFVALPGARKRKERRAAAAAASTSAAERDATARQALRLAARLGTALRMSTSACSATVVKCASEGLQAAAAVQKTSAGARFDYANVAGRLFKDLGMAAPKLADETVRLLRSDGAAAVVELNTGTQGTVAERAHALLAGTIDEIMALLPRAGTTPRMTLVAIANNAWFVANEGAAPEQRAEVTRVRNTVRTTLAKKYGDVISDVAFAKLVRGRAAGTGSVLGVAGRTQPADVRGRAAGTGSVLGVAGRAQPAGA